MAKQKDMRLKGIATFEGLTVGKNKSVVVKFKLRYDEIVTSVGLLQGLNTDITIQAKIAGAKAMNLGIFTVGALNFDRDGNATIPFKSMVDSVELGNINSLIGEDYIQLRFIAVLELPENEIKEIEGGGEEWEE